MGTVSLLKYYQLPAENKWGQSHFSSIINCLLRAFLRSETVPIYFRVAVGNVPGAIG
jgi:hypothetical protein